MTTINNAIYTEDDELRRMFQIAAARKNFWYFCHIMVPSFYKEERTYLKEWCDIMQSLYEDKDNFMLMEMISGPPRHGKSLTSQLFCAWCIGKNPLIRLGVICYSKQLSLKFAKAVRGFILEKSVKNESAKQAGREFTYNDIFPDISLQEKAIEQWKVKGASETTFLSVSCNTSIIGYGFDILLVDDLIKDAKEVYNQNAIDEKVSFLANTVTSRLEGNKKMLMTMHRWSATDVSAKIKNIYTTVREHMYPTRKEDGTMLCDEIMNLDAWEKTRDVYRKGAGLPIFYANYQQELISNVDKLYNIKSYNGAMTLPNDVHAVCDVANGSDFLCVIAFVPIGDYIYVKDVLYTDDVMENTEPLMVEFLYRNGVRKLIAENNGAGNVFIRNVKAKYNRKYGTRCLFRTFTQTQNKEGRILSNAGWVNEYVVFPDNADVRFEDFFLDVNRFSSIYRKNRHDDCADALTIIAENYSVLSKKKARLYR